MAVGVARDVAMVVLVRVVEGVIERQEQALERRVPKNWESTLGITSIARLPRDPLGAVVVVVLYYPCVSSPIPSILGTE